MVRWHVILARGIVLKSMRGGGVRWRSFCRGVEAPLFGGDDAYLGPKASNKKKKKKRPPFPSDHGLFRRTTGITKHTQQLPNKVTVQYVRKTGDLWRYCYVCFFLYAGIWDTFYRYDIITCGASLGRHHWRIWVISLLGGFGTALPCVRA